MYRTDRIVPTSFYNGDIFFIFTVEVFTGMFLHTSWAVLLLATSERVGFDLFLFLCLIFFCNIAWIAFVSMEKTFWLQI